ALFASCGGSRGVRPPTAGGRSLLALQEVREVLALRVEPLPVDVDAMLAVHRRLARAEPVKLLSPLLAQGGAHFLQRLFAPVAVRVHESLAHGQQLVDLVADALYDVTVYIAHRRCLRVMVPCHQFDSAAASPSPVRAACRWRPGSGQILY